MALAVAIALGGAAATAALRPRPLPVVAVLPAAAATTTAGPGAAQAPARASLEPRPWSGAVTAGRPGDGTGDGAPVRVTAPAIGLDADLVELGIRSDGSMEVPGEPLDAGWLVDSSLPGSVGPAVIAGHVDSRSGPAVFFRLDELAPGDSIDVTMSDGTRRGFVVTRVLQAAKDAFPTEEVYGPVPDAQLRLITCGGAFDTQRRSYEDNVVVFARLAA